MAMWLSLHNLDKEFYLSPLKLEDWKHVALIEVF